MIDKFKIQKIDFDVVEKNDNFVLVSHNGLDVMLDPTRTLFNASRLIDTINPSKDGNGRTVSKWEMLWNNNQRFYQFREFHNAQVVNISAKVNIVIIRVNTYELIYLMSFLRIMTICSIVIGRAVELLKNFHPLFILSMIAA